MQVETIAYSISSSPFEGYLIYNETSKVPQPLLLMAPNWLGVTPGAIEVGKQLAAQGYTLFVADMYGVGARPTGNENAMTFLQPLIQDPATTRARINAALNAMTDAALERGVGNPAFRAAIGYCFGGSNVLDLARSGADVAAVVSMHGNLKTSLEAAAGSVKAAVLVVHGADDPIAPKSDRDALENEMRKAGARWTMLSFGGVLHSFTDPAANRPPTSRYSAQASRHGYALAQAFINDAFCNRI